MDDTSVLVAVASADSYEGQVRCVDVLRSLLGFFLGRSVDADVSLSRVSGIEGEALAADPVDICAPPARPRHSASTSDQGGRAPEDWTPPLTERRSSGTIALSYYGDVSYTLDVVPVWRLDQHTISAYAIRPSLPAGVECLSDLDLEALAHLTIGQLLPILEDYRREGGSFALLAPLPFSVLSARRPRMALLDRCTRFRSVMRTAVIIEITHLHAGAPAGLIKETVAMIRPFVRVVTATIRSATDVTAVSRESAFHGLAVEWRGASAGDLQSVLRAARRRSPNLMVHGVPTHVPGEHLKSLQATHLSWLPPAQIERVTLRPDPQS